MFFYIIDTRLWGRLATARDRLEKQYAKEKPPAVIYKLTGKNMKQKEMYYDKA